MGVLVVAVSEWMVGGGASIGISSLEQQLMLFISIFNWVDFGTEDGIVRVACSRSNRAFF